MTFRYLAHPSPKLVSTFGKTRMLDKMQSRSLNPYRQTVPIIPSPSNSHSCSKYSIEPTFVVSFTKARVLSTPAEMIPGESRSRRLVKQVARDYIVPGSKQEGCKVF